MKEKKTKNKHTALKVVMVILLILISVGALFSYWGGFSTGDCADTEEFAKYAGTVNDITVPKQARVIALGEATHGNKEFQKLKLDVFRVLVEKYDVKAFALEGDCGGCEAVNRYIHGGEGTSKEAAAAIGFAIYRTDEMAQLLDWMREYNKTAGQMEDIRFYGFDMQRIAFNYRYLIEEAKSFEIDTAGIESVWDESAGDTRPDKSNEEILTELLSIKSELEEHDVHLTSEGIHYADILIQNIKVGEAANSGTKYSELRDKYMAANIMWILEQEEQRGHNQIFISAHNGHVEKQGTYSGTKNKVTGALLYDELGDGYYAIGTDFYKTRVNLPSSGYSRSKHTFFSHDPLAKAAKENGFDISYLDFGSVPEDSALRTQIDGYIWEGSLGESYSSIMSLLPMTYRTWRSPSQMYDAMIYVSNAHATDIYSLEE